jgi:hypothetical protein
VRGEGGVVESVWLVTCWNYDKDWISAAFATEELAEEYARLCRSDRVQAGVLRLAVNRELPHEHEESKATTKKEESE